MARQFNRKKYFLNHLKLHKKQQCLAGAREKDPVPDSSLLKKKPGNAAVNGEGFNGEGVKGKPQVKRYQSKERVPCHICDVQLEKKNLKRHCKTKHNVNIEHSAVCYDTERGLYMVRRSKHEGISYPIHVQKILNSNEDKVIDCEVSS